MTRQSYPFACLILLAAAAIPACAQTASAAAHAAPVTCKSSWPVAGLYPMLQKRTLPSGKIEYYGRYKMWSPIGNQKACDIRQILFNVGRLANDLPQGSANGPVLTLIVQHGNSPGQDKDMKVHDTSVNPNGPAYVIYTVDAQAAQPKGGIYYAKISVVGDPPAK